MNAVEFAIVKRLFTRAYIFISSHSPKKTERSAYSALSSGYDYVGKYFVYGNWFTCEERKRLISLLIFFNW